jgi:cytoskeletal protein CcmA (bactofilin family)
MSDPREKSKQAAESLDSRPLSSVSTLGPTAKLKGEWVCAEDVIIQGKFQGKIDAGNHDIHIEKNATVKAEIQGKNITIRGNVTGNVVASGKIHIGKEAQITGDLSALQIAIQEGAKFKGSVKMLP